MNLPNCNASVFYQLFQQYKEAQLLIAGINLGVFSHLAAPKSAGEIAAAAGYNTRNLALFLDALASIGLLIKSGEKYGNTPEAETFLNRESPYYLGEYLLFRQGMTSLDNVEARVRQGPDRAVQAHNQGQKVYNFRELARLSAKEVYTGRVQAFLRTVSLLFQPAEPVRFLDLGGGSGMLAIEFSDAYLQAEGVIFEHPAVAEVPAEFVAKRGLQQRLTVLQGDFILDDIGSGYDLIIASGIMDFAGANLQSLVDKLARSLKPGGYLYLVCHNVREDFLFPKEPVVNWLSSRLAGLDILLSKNAIEEALAAAGFVKTLDREQAGVIQKLSGEVYQRSIRDGS